MTVSRNHRSKKVRKGEPSLEVVAGALLVLASNHDKPRNDLRGQTTAVRVVKRDSTRDKFQRKTRRYRIGNRTANITARLPHVDNTIPVVIPDYDACDENCTSSVSNGRCASAKTVHLDSFPGLQFRNYNDGKPIPGDIGSIKSTPMVGKPLGLPPRLPLVGRKKLSPASFPKASAGSKQAFAFVVPPSFQTIPKVIEYCSRHSFD